jgi:hypothetical protein
MSDRIEPPFDTCERHPDCLFQGGCECKRQAMRERAIEPPSISERVNVWMRYRGDWVVLAKGHTRWHAEHIARPEHVVLPIGQEPDA